MKKMSLLLALILLLCMTACGQDTATLPDGTSYAIKVVDGEGKPIPEALVSICQNTEGGICYMPVKTDENGVAYFLEAAVPVQNNVKVRVLMAQGYELPQDDAGEILYTVIPDGTNQMTLTLSKTA